MPTKTGVSALSLTVAEPPSVGTLVDTSLGPGRLLYSIPDERWIVLVGTKGYVAEVNVETNAEEANDADTVTTPSDCHCCGADCTCEPHQTDID